MFCIINDQWSRFGPLFGSSLELAMQCLKVADGKLNEQSCCWLVVANGVGRCCRLMQHWTLYAAYKYF